MLIKGGSSVSNRLLALLNTDTYDGYPQSVTARPTTSDERHGGSLAIVFQHGVFRLGSPGSLFDKYARILWPRPSASDEGRCRPKSQRAARDCERESNTAAAVAVLMRVAESIAEY
ncbi:hypothetical protein G5I_05459 [Acromyrmex echinatior]|uniref:Uncharacterized protein n=1 Tax=Acromyrmex echinatior TaxID=103372 RepID=F4WID6_ACREC|nr:hypothetical protein G5I_05459 [Acromyrmex echinatior]